MNNWRLKYRKAQEKEEESDSFPEIPKLLTQLRGSGKKSEDWLRHQSSTMIIMGLDRWCLPKNSFLQIDGTFRPSSTRYQQMLIIHAFVPVKSTDGIVSQLFIPLFFI